MTIFHWITFRSAIKNKLTMEKFYALLLMHRRNCAEKSNFCSNYYVQWYLKRAIYIFMRGRDTIFVTDKINGDIYLKLFGWIFIWNWKYNKTITFKAIVLSLLYWRKKLFMNKSMQASNPKRNFFLIRLCIAH